MSAYIMLIRNETRDPVELATYARLASKAPIEKLQVIASKADRFEVLEGGPAETAVILRFPTWDDALAWYRSPEYEEARRHRLLGADSRAILVEGVEALA